ncbi:MAG: TadE/TadG family type IV pilus assembly protein [Candidatus Dormibacteria bacterium]
MHPRRVRGQSLVEFALVVPILLLLFAGGTDLARAYFLGVELQDGVRSAALYAASNPSPPPSSGALQQIVTAAVTPSAGNPISSFLGCTSLSVPAPTTSTSGAPSGSSYENVTASCQMTLLTPILPFGSVTIRTAAQSLIVPST